MREISRVVVAAGDQCRRRRPAPRHEDIAAVQHKPFICHRRGFGCLCGTGQDHREGPLRRLQHHLFEGDPAAVEDPVQAVADLRVVDVPSDGLPLQHIPDRHDQVGIFADTVGTGRHQGTESEEVCLHAIEECVGGLQLRSRDCCNVPSAFPEALPDLVGNARAPGGAHIPEPSLQMPPHPVLVPYKRRCPRAGLFRHISGGGRQYAQ